MTLDPWWRSEMRRIDAQRSAALAAADQRFDAVLRSENRRVAMADTPEIDTEEKPSSYLLAANLDRRGRPPHPTDDETDTPRTTWLV